LANYPIQDSSGWLTILRKFGLTGIVRWVLSDTVIPVALIDSEVTLNASASTPLVNVPASGGEFTAPAANTRLANTGPLPAGPYSMVFWLSDNEPNNFRIRRRNAADTADIWSYRLSNGGSVAQPTTGFIVISLRLLLAVNEFMVIENINAGAAGTLYQSAIFVAAG
jgi:hypothetical protein